jgi:drug/metabolite transporter (DMT)-like permease
MALESLSAVCGIGSAVAWGAGDFSGGLASRKSNVYTVVLFSQLVGALLLTGMALISGEPVPQPASLIFGGIGGVCGSLGLIALYRAFARGRMGIVAPVSAIITAILPIVFTFFHRGLPETIQIVGFALALTAVWLISHVKGDAGLSLEEMILPMVAGLGFGLYFTLLGLAAEESITWPLLSARGASLAVVFTFFMMKKTTGRPSRAQFLLIALTGSLDAGGNVLFAVAAHLGRLDIAATLSSLYPAVTVMLAWAILKERLVPQQWVGVVVAMVALVCIT